MRLGRAAGGAPTLAPVLLVRIAAVTLILSGCAARIPAASQAETATVTPAPSPSKPPFTPTPVATPWMTPSVVTYVDPYSVSFATAEIGWAVGMACGTAGACETAVARTIDGGAGWSLTSPPVPPGQQASLSILAGSSQDAWVWGVQMDESAVLTATHNGGTSWQPVSTGGLVTSDVVLANASVWALIGCPPGGASCPDEVLTAPVGGGSWVELSQLPDSVGGPAAGNSNLGSALSPQLIQAAGRAWVLSGGTLVTTGDAGLTWISLPVPCQAQLQALAVAAWSASSLMLVCGIGGARPAPQEIWASADGGRHWSLRSRAFASVISPALSDVGSLASQGLPSGIAMTGSDTAWIWGDREQDMMSADGGVTWKAADLPYGAAGGAYGEVFTDAEHGWTFGADGLWATVNGGVDWTYQPILGPVTG